VAGSPRSFRPEDGDAVLALSRHALARLEEQVGKPLWSTREELEAELGSWGESAAATLRVVEEDGEIAAFGGLAQGGDPVVLGPLVAPRFRGQKLGSVLLEATLAVAHERETGWVSAAVGARNVGGRLLLERKGFHRHGEGLDSVYRLFPADHRPAGAAPPGIVVRRGGVTDLPVIWRLYREVFPIGRRTESVWLHWLEAGEVCVAERGGEVVAFVHLEPAARWISHVGVAEEARGLGVGGYLFSFAVEEYWREHPDTELRLTLIPYNTPAIRIYRRLGFAPWLLLQTFELEL
jgi:GNAT superfamily N-acetyltransferase